MPQFAFSSPLGDLTLTEEDDAIVSLDWGRGAESAKTPLLQRAKDLLERYFDGLPVTFDLPFAPAGTPFQKSVWAALTEIPCGHTKTYGELAEMLKSAPRAVGSACGRNPIPILIPCHRVLAAGGLAGGYTAPGGLESKAFLLGLEGVPLSR